MKKTMLIVLLLAAVCSNTLQAGNFLSTKAYAVASDTLRLMIIGNSFSQNATKYLKELTAERHKVLIIGRAELGGCSLERHWNLAAESEADSTSKPYGQKSLKMLLEEEQWDIVTIQQNSMNSSAISTYRPYAKQLYDHIKRYAPNAEIVIHQTWAYRSDADQFGKIDDTRHAATEKEMWQESRKAYHTIANELGIRIIPVGDAFWQAGQDPRYSYKKDEAFDFDHPVHPLLPDQSNSLHAGYHWNAEGKLALDTHHANDAGCYLGSLIWFGFLFDASPEQVQYQPETIDKTVGEHLRKTAAGVLKETAIDL